MANDIYSVEILEASAELTKREKVMFKDTSNAVKFDDVVTPEQGITITPTGWVKLAIHNPKGERKDFENLVITTYEGEKFVTGSPTFIEKFLGIWEDMYDPNEDFQIEVFKRDSKNYKGKQFLSCAVV